MLPMDRPEKPKKIYKIPAVSKKRAAAIADGSFKQKEHKPLTRAYQAPKDCTYKKKPKTINVRSKKRAAQERLYSEKTRPEFLKDKEQCEAKLEGCTYFITDIHHKGGKENDLLNYSPLFLGVCRNCHDKIGDMGKAAFDLGFSVSRTKNSNKLK